MKRCLCIIFFAITFSSYSQNDSITNMLSVKRELLDCETISLNAVDHLAIEFKTNNFSLYNQIIDVWTASCGLSECSARIIIIKKLIDGENVMEAIQDYFENKFYYPFRNRVNDAVKADYGYLYTSYKSYYGYVPFRHPIDSICADLASVLLKSDSLSSDEKLICVLFSGDLEKFEKEIKTNKYKDSYIKNYFAEEVKKYYDSGVAFSLYSGLYSTVGSEKIFTNSPTLGLTFGTPLKYKLTVELGMKFRINMNDKDFKFYALGDTNQVNSDMSVFFGGLIGYKLVESKKFVFTPKLGIGLESVSTGISQENNSSNQSNTVDANTIHLSLGFSVMKPVFKKNYIGFELGYHYCPYQLIEKLYTKFDNNAVSGELFFKF